jgi:hypothetical protein
MDIEVSYLVLWKSFFNLKRTEIFGLHHYLVIHHIVTIIHTSCSKTKI